MAGLLQGLRGRFLLSINDTPEIRALYHWARIEDATTTYSAAAGPRKPVTELLISSQG